MSELCEHETFTDVCSICHRDAEITRLRAEVERLRAALIVWRNAYKTGRNEPLVQAYEHSEALAAQPAPGKEEA